MFLIAGRHRIVAIATEGHFHALKEWSFFHARMSDVHTIAHVVVCHSPTSVTLLANTPGSMHVAKLLNEAICFLGS